MLFHFLSGTIGPSAVLIFCLLVLSACENAPPQKIGYIDTSELLNRYDRAIQVRTDLQATTGQWQAQGMGMGQELDALRQRFVNEHDRMPASAQKKLREDIAAKEQAFAQFVQEAGQKASALEAEKMQPVYREINAVLRAYGREYGYYIIWGATPGGNIVYADSSSNLTNAVLAYIQNRNEKQPETEKPDE